MSDLVGKSDDRYSSDAAQYRHLLSTVLCDVMSLITVLTIKPDLNRVMKKTCLRGFRSGPTQTGLHIHIIWLKA